MTLPPKPRGMTGKGARSRAMVACQPTILELPMASTPPGAGMAVASARSNARTLDSNRVGSGQMLPVSAVAAAQTTSTHMDTRIRVRRRALQRSARNVPGGIASDKDAASQIQLRLATDPDAILSQFAVKLATTFGSLPCLQGRFGQSLRPIGYERAMG